MAFMIPGAKDILKAALDQNWEDIEKLSSINSLALISPLSEHNDNILHFLVQSKRIDLLDKIADNIQESDPSFLIQQLANVDGNTVLHEAAISGNLEAVNLLVDKNRELPKMKNKSGETPLFGAAAFGKTKVVKFLASHRGRDEDAHCKRNDGASILFAAVQGKHFGTALEVLKLYEHITQSEDENQTSLHMLAKMPAALKSEQEIGTWKKFLHFCLPLGYGHNDDADNIETEDEIMNEIKLEATESGIQSKGSQVGCSHTDDNAKLETKDNRETEGGADIDDNTEGGHQPKGLSVSSDDHNPKSKHEDKKSCLSKGCPLARKLWKEKRENEFAYELARQLIQKDLTWEKSIMRSGLPTKQEEEAEQRIPLFAARKENAKAVEYVLELYPPALEQINRRKSPEADVEEKEECGDEEEREYIYL